MKDDRELRRDILDELEWEPSIAAAEIGVAAHGGIVTLTGPVGSDTEKLAAERVARRVKGVRATANLKRMIRHQWKAPANVVAPPVFAPR